MSGRVYGTKWEYTYKTEGNSHSEWCFNYVQIPRSDAHTDKSQLAGAHRTPTVLVGPGDTLATGRHMGWQSKPPGPWDRDAGTPWMRDHRGRTWKEQMPVLRARTLCSAGVWEWLMHRGETRTKAGQGPERPTRKRDRSPT